jgi:hypothetical protein
MASAATWKYVRAIVMNDVTIIRIRKTSIRIPAHTKQ